LGNRGGFPFSRGGGKNGRLDLSRHQLIGEYLGILEGVRLAEQDLQYSRQSSGLINRQDQKGSGSELPTNSRFNPFVCLSILDTENLAPSVGVYWDSQRGGYLPPYIRRGTSASGPVNQLVSLEKGDGDSSGVGDVSGTFNDVVHCNIQVELSPRDQPLDFHDGGEWMAIYLTLLHHKSAGQKQLESFPIEAGKGTHTRLCGDTGGRTWSGEEPNHTTLLHSAPMATIIASLNFINRDVDTNMLSSQLLQGPSQ
jgi:hypothetical protein